MPTIKVSNVSKYYANRRWWQFWSRRKEIGVENVDLTIEQGEFIFLIGSSGSGKSTLLSLLSGEIKPDRGRVTVNGRDISRLRKRHPTRFAHTIGIVSQEHRLDRNVTISRNLERAVRNSRRTQTVSVEERIAKVLGLVGLPDVQDRYTGDLNPGERRRVELAAAMINSPDILILDEAVANQDEDTVWDTFLLLTEINRKGTTIIMTIRNSQFVNMLRRRVITLVDGKIYSDVDKGRYGEAAKK